MGNSSNKQGLIDPLLTSDEKLETNDDYNNEYVKTNNKNDYNNEYVKTNNNKNCCQECCDDCCNNNDGNCALCCLSLAILFKPL
jgi:hypothetical protein